MTSPDTHGIKLIDTCVNLQDSMFQGIYNGKQKHEPDFEQMMTRAAEHGIEKVIGVSGSLSDSEHSISVAKQFPNVFATVGVHPTRCGEFDDKDSGDPDAHLAALAKLAEAGGKDVVAIGEIGLDYDREEFCPRDVQQKYFVKQLQLAKQFNLPVVFHNRNTGGDFERMVREQRESFRTGIVHSFTGTAEEMEELVGLGLYMGINGCGLKTEENCEVVKRIPLDRLVLETDAPWCVGSETRMRRLDWSKPSSTRSRKRSLCSGRWSRTDARLHTRC